MSKITFKELNVWKEAKSLAVEIYKITNNDKFMKDFSLRDQIRRATVSIASNIAEGNERDTEKELVRFLHIAKGSLAELLTQLEISKEIGYIGKEEADKLESRCICLGKMLGSFIRKINENTTDSGP